MKKVLVVFLVLFLFISLVACSSPSPTPSPAPAPTTVAQAPTTAAPPASPGPKPTTASPTASPTPTAAPPKPVEITYANPNSITDSQFWVNSVKPWGEAVAKDWPGFTVKAYHDGSLLKSQEVAEGVKNGIGASGLMQLPYWPKLFPANNVSNTRIFGMDSYETVLTARIIWTQFSPFTDELDKEGIVSLFAIATAPVHIITKKPVSVLDDLKGQRIRTAGSGTAAVVEGSGAATVAMGISEVYEAIQRGVIDGAATILPSMRDAQYSKLAKYIVYMGAAGALNSGIIIGFNANVWKGLPADLKKIMVQQAQKREGEFARFFVQDEQAALDTMIKQDGVQLVEFSEAEMRQWQSNARDMFAEWAASVEPQGIPGNAIVARIKEVVALPLAEKEKLWEEAWQKYSAYLLSR
ncbi:MAG: TRAP transporter substrate-binding protein DctP [Chloroflexi bacterium]|nr:TRAP transporter substrate-binding protein DctP [Chloroflexota bacterium]